MLVVWKILHTRKSPWIEAYQKNNNTWTTIKWPLDGNNHFVTGKGRRIFGEEN
jgi:hypothetical protein